MKRKWIQQPLGKNQCGQVAVAVIAGISLEESIKVVGKKGCTKTKDLVAALRKLGFKCPDRCKRVTHLTSPISLAIAQVHSHPRRRSGWHWVVLDGDKIWDGMCGNRSGHVSWDSDWKITSYLPVEE